MTTATRAPTEVDRDHWGRPLVIPPDGGKPTAYTRVTTYVGCLEDTYNLSLWQQRMVALGLASRPDLLLRVNSLGFEPTELGEVPRWKKAMNETVEAAMEAARSSAAATIGTSLHALTERLDRGQDVGFVPEEYRGHLSAYQAATVGFTALHIEAFTVNDELQLGGTPDRVVTVDGFDGAFIADLKTGTHGVDYGPGKMAMQLAVYARSQLYDAATGARTDYAERVNRDRGIIIALNSKTGICDLHWIDLAAGWEAVQLAGPVRRWQKVKGLTTSYVPEVIDRITGEVAGSLLPTLEPDANAALFAAIDAAPTAAELVELWRAAGPRWTVAHSTRASARKAQLA